MAIVYGINGVSKVPSAPITGYGAPAASFKAELGQPYFDKSTNPYTQYIYNGSTWEAGGNAEATTTTPGIVTIDTDGTLTGADDTTVPTSLAVKTYADSIAQLATVTVSTAELLALATTPKELVAAPGAGFFIEFLGAKLILNYNSIQYTEAGDNLGIKYTDASGVQVSDTIESTGFIDQAADTITNAVAVKDAIVAATGCVNQALVLDNLGSNFALGNSEMFVQVRYRIAESGL